MTQPHQRVESESVCRYCQKPHHTHEGRCYVTCYVDGQVRRCQLPREHEGVHRYRKRTVIVRERPRLQNSGSPLQ